ncbi:MAG: hypothetical protein QW794_01855 [Thermosphaera sp.]
MGFEFEKVKKYYAELEERKLLIPVKAETSYSGTHGKLRFYYQDQEVPPEKVIFINYQPYMVADIAKITEIINKLEAEEEERRKKLEEMWKNYEQGLVQKYNRALNLCEIIPTPKPPKRGNEKAFLTWLKKLITTPEISELRSITFELQDHPAACKKFGLDLSKIRYYTWNVVYSGRGRYSVAIYFVPRADQNKRILLATGAAMSTDPRDFSLYNVIWREE